MKTTPTSQRDLAVDLARVGCLLIVVAIHVGMVGIGGAELRVSNPLTGWEHFAVATWLGQVMPLFFLLGGYGAFHAMRRAEGEGTPFAHHVRARVLRIGLPAVPFFALLAAFGLVLVAAGVPDALADAALEGAGEPLWFMAAFLLCQGLVGVQYGVVSRRSIMALAWLVTINLGAIVAVDAWRLASVDAGGSTLPGMLNMALVWPLLQLAGMLLARGDFDVIRPWGWAVLAIAGLVATATLAGFGEGTRWYSEDMLTNLNPPTLALVTVGIMHLGLFQLLRPGLRRLAAVRPVQAVLLLVAPRAMHLYLWHMLVIILVAAGMWALGWDPEPGEAVWWWTRIPVFVVVMLLTLGLTWPGARLEAVRPRHVVRSRAATALAWTGLAAATLPNLLVTRLGLDVELAALGLVLTGVAVTLAWWPDRNPHP
ncbi:MAG: acyltransferase [Micrococcus sp.]|nr:acyltransferase [Micrococcus sp.]